MKLETRVRLLGVAAMLLLPVLTPAIATDYCATEKPESILGCYSHAVAKRNIEALSLLLADDYECLFPDSDPPQEPLDLAEELHVMRSMFSSEDIRHMVLLWGPDYTVAPADTSGAWVIKNIPVSLSITGKTPSGWDGPFTMKHVTSLWVRHVSEPEPHYEIFREEIYRAQDQ